MRRNTLNSFLLLAMVAVTIACKTKKLVVAPPKPAEPIAVDSKKSETIQMLKAKDLVFNTLSLKAKANVDFNGNSNNVTMNVRIQKDEKIWVSLTAIAGIEVARALITPDSIKVRNNMQNVYLNKPFSYVHRFTNQQVDFKVLQSILSGNTIADLLVEQSALEFSDGIWVLNGEKKSLVYRVLFNTLLKPSENELNDASFARSLKVIYGDYQQIDGALFPSTMKISALSGIRKVNINLEFSKIDRNVPLEFPFNVPKKFEVIN